jgi:predicted nucleic acid-binding protein
LEEDAKISLDFVDNSQVFALNENVVNTCIEIRKKYRIKVPDAIIAATSITNKFELVTRNVSDFKKIKELNWTNPFED